MTGGLQFDAWWPLACPVRVNLQVRSRGVHSEVAAVEVSKHTQKLARMSTQHSVRHRTVKCVTRPCTLGV